MGSNPVPPHLRITSGYMSRNDSYISITLLAILILAVYAINDEQTIEPHTKNPRDSYSNLRTVGLLGTDGPYSKYLPNSSDSNTPSTNPDIHVVPVNDEQPRDSEYEHSRPNTDEVRDYITRTFQPLGGEAVQWGLAVASCESSFNPDAFNRSSGCVGLYQFLESTFCSNGGNSITDWREQVRIAAKIYAQGGQHHWDYSRGCWERCIRERNCWED